MSVSEAEWAARQWWCFLLVGRGGAWVMSLTHVGIPEGDYLREWQEEFGEFVIIDPPQVLFF